MVTALLTLGCLFPTNVTLILSTIIDAISLNAIPKDEITETFLEYPAVATLANEGGLLNFLLIPVVFVGLLILFGCIQCARNC